MAVPYTFASATTSLPLSQLDSNFNTPITIGNTSVQLGNTVTTLNNMTLANVAMTTLSGMTANAVIFADSSNTFSSSSFFTFTGSRVGIGASSPDSLLTLESTGLNSKITVRSTSSSASSPPFVIFSRNTTTGSAIQTVGQLGWINTLTDGTSASPAWINCVSNNNAGSNTGNLYYNALTTHNFQINTSTFVSIDSSGNLITNVNSSAPSLSTNKTMSFELTSNTQLKIVVRGSDGVTRSTTLTLS